MKVSRKKTGRISPGTSVSSSADTGKTQKSGGAQKNQKAEAVNVVISERSKEIGEAKALIETMPEMRIEKISSIKGAVEDGSYHVDSYELAKKIVHEALLESLRRKK